MSSKDATRGLDLLATRRLDVVEDTTRGLDLLATRRLDVVEDVRGA
jgi:hypothetical protein